MLGFHNLWSQHLHSIDKWTRWAVARTHCTTSLYKVSFTISRTTIGTLPNSRARAVYTLQMCWTWISHLLNVHSSLLWKRKNAFGAIEIVFWQYFTISSSLFYNFPPHISHRPALLVHVPSVPLTSEHEKKTRTYYNFADCDTADEKWEKLLIWRAACIRESRAINTLQPVACGVVAVWPLVKFFHFPSVVALGFTTNIVVLASMKGISSKKKRKKSVEPGHLRMRCAKS